nr:unnamed protein product [Naegleria fowleri]
MSVTASFLPITATITTITTITNTIATTSDITATTTTTNSSSFSSSSGLSYCAIANTSLIPLTVNILREQEQEGIQCPFGFFKRLVIKNSNTLSFECVSVMDMLNEIVDRKDCEFVSSSIDSNNDELDTEGPSTDLRNCVFDFLHCSPRTRKCTFTNTRAQGDACVDRYSCVGSIQKVTTNCYEGKCTTMKANPSLPVGAPCFPFVTSDSGVSSMTDMTSESRSFIHVLNNTYDTCVQNAICTLSNGTHYHCIRLQTKRAVISETCGESQKFSNVQDMSYKMCQSGTSCEPLQQQQQQQTSPFSRIATTATTSISKKVCIPYLLTNDFSDRFRFPFNSLLMQQECPLNYKMTSTYMGERNLCVKNGSEICLNDNTCGGFDSLNIKASYSFKSVPYPSYFRQHFMNKFTKCDDQKKKCIRIFGKENGVSCGDHSECRSTYCNAANGICSELPKEVPCGPSVTNPSISKCPGYSHCVCANSTQGVCVNLCFAELSDLHTCGYNYGIFGEHSPISKMEQSLIPFIDQASSLFSLENGKCKDYLNNYYECMKSVQQSLNLETLSLSNISHSISPSAPEVNDRVFNDLYKAYSSVSPPLISVQMNESYKPATPLEPIQLNIVDMLKDYSSLMKKSNFYKNVKVSNQVVILTMERMVGLIPRYKSKTIDFSNINACGCCTSNMTEYLEASIEGGILLISQSRNSSLYLNTVDLSIKITGFESIMGHDSFLNRNWFEQCDVILAPPQDIDLITLSIKNNMLILDQNSTTGAYSIQELEQKAMSDLFMVFTSNVPSKVLTIPRDVRNAAMINSQLLDKVLTAVGSVMIQNYNNFMQLMNNNTNFTDCSMFNSTFTVKDYHTTIFSYPLVFDFNYPMPISSSSFIIEYDSWLAMNITNQYGLFSQNALSMMDKLVDPNCYSSYNSYLGVFHYNDVSQFWDLVLKDFMLWTVIVSCLFFYVFLIGMFRKNIAMQRRLFGPYIAPFCILIISLMYIEPILMSLFKNVGKNIIPLIPIPNFFMSLLSASYIVISIRFYYLRNLYQILKHFHVSMTILRILKRLAHPFIIFLIVMFTAMIMFAIWFGIFYGVLHNIIIEKFGRFEWTLQFDASLLALTTQFGFLSLISILCLVYDGISNRRKIRKHGFSYYYMFDDPFHLRVDIISQLMILLTSILVVLDIFVWKTLVINRIGIALFFLCSLMIFGGNIMLLEIVSLLKNKKWMKTACCYEPGPEEVTDIEKEWYEHMKDINFRELQEAFAINFHSAENLYFYELLEKLEKKHQITFNDFQQLGNIIDCVNLSADSQNLYQQLATHLTNNPNETIPFHQLEPIKIEVVVQNILPSIFMPLKHKKEYLKWKHVTLLQKEASVVDVKSFEC